jgi:GH35 family endo-1,4-beta-xylanase
MIRFCRSRDIGIRGHYLSWAPLTRAYTKPTDYGKHPGRLWPELSAHIDEMLAFTDGRLAEWDAINHIIGWGDTLATAAGSNEIYARIIRHARSKTRTPLWVNEGGILPGGSRLQAYEAIIRYLVANDATPDGIGFMAHFREASLRPIDELWNVYERFARFGVPLQLTEFDIDTRQDQLQADYLRDVMTITFSHPSFNAIVMWGFWEGRHWRPNAALWRRDWSIKPAGTVWKDLVFKTWWTDRAGKTDSGGQFTTRAFLGTYRVTVGEGKTRQTKDVTLDRDGATVTVRLPRRG